MIIYEIVYTNKIKVMGWCNYLELCRRFLFLSGCIAACKFVSLDLRPQQLPTMSSIQMELITLKVSVFLMNLATVGF